MSSSSASTHPSQPPVAANAELLVRVAALRLSQRRYREALEHSDQALALQPRFPEALYNRGNALLGLGKDAAALASYEQAIALNPSFAAAFNNRGTALQRLRRLDEALQSYQRALALRGEHAGTLNNCGNVLRGLHRLEEAVAYCERALRLEPCYPGALTNRGSALLRSGRLSEAVASFDQALEVDPQFALAWFSKGIALRDSGRPELSLGCFERLMQLEPRFDFARGFLCHTALVNVDWTDESVRREQLLDAVRGGERADTPFPLLAVSAEAGLQLSCARTYMSQEASAMGRLCPDTPYGHERLRVGYLSGDLRDHAVAYLISGVIEQHDRKGFEPYALSLRPPDQSRYGQRIASSVTEFLDLSRSSDAQAASLIRAREIDILIDLSGYTQGSRSAILAHRPAPLQVNYLGFPATMGAPYIDYLIADEYLIPEASRLHYAEQIVYLPECFQANDDRRAFPTTTSRAQLGLPEEGLILCCFNNSYKINPTIFSIWMRLLQRHEHCYLWLVAGSDLVQQNLRREASARAVAPQRLLFAPRVPYEQHLARLGAADLFLDTLPFNGGTTVSDALWAGLPVLSCSGEALASRMAGSLLRTVALSELIACDLSDYERRADQLIGSPAELSGLRARLLASRHSSPLFNTERFTRHLEQALIAMHENFRSQRPTQHLFIPPLP